MPDVLPLSIDGLLKEVEEVADLGIPAVILFGIPAEEGRDRAARPTTTTGIVQQAVRAIKTGRRPSCSSSPTSACASTRATATAASSQRRRGRQRRDARAARAGRPSRTPAPAPTSCAPSDMMDGRVGAIREALDEDGLRPRADHGLRRQVRLRLLRPLPRRGRVDAAVRRPARLPDGPANAREALREVALDIDEGADIVMVKPALPYLDVIWQRARRASTCPSPPTTVSGEYAMVKAAAANGWLDERARHAGDR